MLLILDQLNFTDLLSIAQVNQWLSKGASYTAKLKYSEHKISVWCKDMEPAKKNIIAKALTTAINRIGVFMEERTIKEYESLIYIRDYDSILKTFKYLGVRNLELYSSYDTEDRMQLIGSLINEYASESLEKVNFVSSVNVIKFITKPLVSVKSVTFSGIMNEYGGDNMEINKLFPSMEKLNLNVFITHIDFLDCHMPRLQQVKMYKCHTSMIEKNPQIRHIELDKIEPELLKNLSLLLPNLETLALPTFELEGESVCFENVTKFTTQSSPKNLHFPKLQYLSVELESRHFTAWMSFLKEHKNVTHFRLRCFDLNDGQINRLIGELPHLTKLSIQRVDDEISADGLLNLLKSHNTLSQIEIVLQPPRNDERIKLALEEVAKITDKISKEWDIKNLVDRILFQRKMQ